ncbi:copper chaperone PCu(A)C [Microlunatus sp. Y2014]|uniref:copper chaperone PCu(A)C n=1 Tax=Microlunatus sp. Y2014 TaxID=3418488 RepID=UPI003DA75C16
MVVLVMLGAAGCQSQGSGAVTFDDGYVKAMPAGEMTAIFGVISNDTGADVTVVSASSEAAETVELHEMVMQDGQMVMRERAGGFVIPAGESMSLEPGGLHLMLIGLTSEIRAGDQVSATLTLADGSTIEVTATGRDMSNAQESYDPESQHGGFLAREGR